VKPGEDGKPRFVFDSDDPAAELFVSVSHKSTHLTRQFLLCPTVVTERMGRRHGIEVDHQRLYRIKQLVLVEYYYYFRRYDKFMTSFS
jgi:hypothetical protein